MLCPACNIPRTRDSFHVPHSIVPRLVPYIQAKRPHWSPQQPVCDFCLNEARADDAEDMLMHEMGDRLTELEETVIKAMRGGSTLSQNPDVMESNRSRREQLADTVANWVGTFKFSVGVLVFVFFWLCLCLVFDLFTNQPAIAFGTLSSILGTLAALQNPVILMSQRRQAQRDRRRSEHEYQVNLKAELEVRYLNAKLDYLLAKHHQHPPEVTD